jgi:hypothetical protein
LEARKREQFSALECAMMQGSFLLWLRPRVRMVLTAVLYRALLPTRGFCAIICKLWRMGSLTGAGALLSIPLHPAWEQRCEGLCFERS